MVVNSSASRALGVGWGLGRGRRRCLRRDRRGRGGRLIRRGRGFRGGFGPVGGRFADRGRSCIACRCIACRRSGSRCVACGRSGSRFRDRRRRRVSRRGVSRRWCRFRGWDRRGGWVDCGGDGCGIGACGIGARGVGGCDPGCGCGAAGQGGTLQIERLTGRRDIGQDPGGIDGQHLLRAIGDRRHHDHESRRPGSTGHQPRSLCRMASFRQGSSTRRGRSDYPSPRAHILVGPRRKGRPRLDGSPRLARTPCCAVLGPVRAPISEVGDGTGSTDRLDDGDRPARARPSNRPGRPPPPARVARPATDRPVPPVPPRTPGGSPSRRRFG